MKIPSLCSRSAATVFAAALLTLMPTRNTHASLLQVVPSSPTLLPGASETVSVMFTSTLTTPFQLTAADIEIAFDATRFAVSNVQLGSLDTGNGFAITSNVTTGLVQVGIDTSSTGNTIAPGQSGTLETFTLTALANAPAGGTLGNINLLFMGTRTQTAVFTDPATGGAIVLTPPPSNGFDAGVDGTVLVGAAVPEPSSWILMGLGGSLVTAASVFRKRIGRAVATPVLQP